MESNCKKRMASLALFRQLYNEKRSDIFTILRQFVIDVISRNNLRSFNVSQIKDLLKKEYEFTSIPDYVITAVLSKFCSKQNGVYTPKDNNIYTDESHQVIDVDLVVSDHESVINQLVSYVEKKKKEKISLQEKENLIQSFCEFLIEESTTIEYTEYISAFILESSADKQFTQQLNTIKEGVVLYTGIKYNDNVNDIGSWKTELTIYLDMEILFHVAGYNGELYKDLFYDFYNLVKEINTKAKKKLIKLKYFEAVEADINVFFNIAERIIEGKETLNSSNQAMAAIVQGCSNSSDIILKKTEFISLLKSLSIHIYEGGEFYSPQNSQFNLENAELLEKLERDLNRNNIEQNLKYLNFVNIKRKGIQTSSFEKVNFILLTGNSTTLDIGFHLAQKELKYVPLATYLSFITNKFWFKLNKGFGDGSYPKGFDIVTKAQIVLSTQLKESVAREFDLLKEKREKGLLTDDQAIASLAMLKNNMLKPEDIEGGNVDEILKNIRECDIEQHIREREIMRKNAEIEKQRNKQLEEELRDVRETNKLKDRERDLCEIESLKIRVSKIEQQKMKADAKINKRINMIKYAPVLFILVGIVLCYILINIYSWDKLESLTYLFSFCPLLIEYTFLAYKGRSINVYKWIDTKYRDKITQEIYEDMGVYTCELYEYEVRRQELEK